MLLMVQKLKSNKLTSMVLQVVNLNKLTQTLNITLQISIKYGLVNLDTNISKEVSPELQSKVEKVLSNKTTSKLFSNSTQVLFLLALQSTLSAHSLVLLQMFVKINPHSMLTLSIVFTSLPTRRPHSSIKNNSLERL